MPDDLGEFDEQVLKAIRDAARKPLTKDTKTCEYCHVTRSTREKCRCCGAP